MTAQRLLSLAFALILCAGLRAQEPSPLVSLEDRLKRLEEKASAKEKPTVTVGGQFQGVGYWFSQTTANRLAYGDIEDGVSVRRARLTLAGEYQNFEYDFGVEFSNPSTPRFLAANGGFKNVPVLGHVRVGHMFEPFGFERISSNRFTTYLERGNISQAFAPGRNMGIAAYDTYADERGFWALGYYRSNSNIQGFDVGDLVQSAITGRITCLPIWSDAGDQYVHLGAAYSLRAAYQNQVQLAAQPEASFGSWTPNVPNFVDTGVIAAPYYQLAGAEFMATSGPVSVVAEYNLASVASDNAGSLFFQGGYVSATWLITGEHRTYNRKFGLLDRVIPNRNMLGEGCACGPGAWELAVRVSYLDLTDGPVNGGRLLDFTAGVNWYLNPYFRMAFNYVHASPDLNPVAGGALDSFGLRFGYDF